MTKDFSDIVNKGASRRQGRRYAAPAISVVTFAYEQGFAASMGVALTLESAEEGDRMLESRNNSNLYWGSDEGGWF